MNLYSRAVGTEEQVRKAKRHDHLPGQKGCFSATVLQVVAEPLGIRHSAFDALALHARGSNLRRAGLAL